jgi:hypothetical protein
MSGELEFRLTIRLGNDAMLTGDDIADALHTIADRVPEHTGTDERAERIHAVSIRDLNGNRVGQWAIREVPET